MKAYNYSDNVFSFEGAISVDAGTNWAMPWRIDCRYADFYPVLADEKARDCSGIRLCFTTDTSNLSLTLVEPVEGMILDLAVDGDVLQHLSVSGAMDRVSFEPLPEGLKQVEIWLDQRFPFRLKEVLVEDAAQICKTLNTRMRWVHYGSSISQAKAGYSPTQTWAALVARRLGLHLTNLGFSGECKLEMMIGRLIRDREADYITLKLGINVYSGDLTRRTFAPNVIGLIQLIRERHPETPLVVISPIYSEPREVTPGGSGLTLPEMREIIDGIVGICHKYGDRNIHYVNGLQIFGSAEAALHMPDQLHPNADGQFLLAEHFIKAVFAKYPVV